MKSIAWRTILYIGHKGMYFLSEGGKLLRKRAGNRDAIYELTEDLYFEDRGWEWIGGYSPQGYSIYMQSYGGNPTGYYKLKIPGKKERFYCRFMGGGGL